MQFTRSAAPRSILCLALVFTYCVLILVEQVSAGGKGKGGEEDIIMYNGNIVMRGDKKGGSIVMANNQPTQEDVEFMPNFFSDFGEMGRR